MINHGKWGSPETQIPSKVIMSKDGVFSMEESVLIKV